MDRPLQVVSTKEGTVMTELTLKDVAKRLTDLECKVAAQSRNSAGKDLRRTVGMFERSEFMAQVEPEILAAREAEREAARSERFE
jgi:hypothetical protein